MSYYDPYYTPRSRRPSLSYTSTPVSLSPTYYDPTYTQPAYSMYTPSTMSSPYLPRTSYDDLVLDPYYPERSRSVVYTPRPRRSSSISYMSSPGIIDPLRRGFGRVLKFKRKGAFQTGITIGEAQANVRLSGAESFTFKDLGVDARGKVFVNLRWPGYSPLNYEIPVDGYGGYVDVQSLARRVARAVSHYLQANVVPIRWDHIEMQYLEELSLGMWHLKMSAQ